MSRITRGLRDFQRERVMHHVKARLSYQINHRAKLAWTEQALHRFKERVTECERSGYGVSGGEPREG